MNSIVPSGPWRVAGELYSAGVAEHPEKVARTAMAAMVAMAMKVWRMNCFIKVVFGQIYLYL